MKKMDFKSLEFYQDLYDNLPDMIIVGDHRRRLIMDCNQTLLNRLGYKKEEFLNLPSYLNLYHPDCYHLLDDFFEKYAKEGHITNYELSLQTKADDKIPVSLSISGVKDENGEVAFSRVVFRDITDLIEARTTINTQMQKYKDKSEELERKNQDLDTFVHLVAHDLRAPLRSISSFAYFLNEDTKNVLTAESKGYLSSLQEKIIKMGNLMNDIIFYFVLNTEINSPETVNLDEFISSIDDILPVPAGFKFKVNSDVQNVNIRKLPLQQVLHNLFNNAIKHHHRPVEGEVEIKVEETDKEYKFHVCDNGPGIPVEYQEYIFKAFKRLKSSDGREGNGLGLAIVKKLISQEGGEITITSEENHGTTFSVCWPKIAA